MLTPKEQAKIQAVRDDLAAVERQLAAKAGPKWPSIVVLLIDALEIATAAADLHPRQEKP